MTDALNYLCERMRQRQLVLYGLGGGETGVFDIAAVLRSKDNTVTPTGALIVASFLEDMLSDVLYTTDKAVLESRILGEAAKVRGKRIMELGSSE